MYGSGKIVYLEITALKNLIQLNKKRDIHKELHDETPIKIENRRSWGKQVAKTSIISK